MIARILIVIALAGLAGCAEREQTASGIRSDAAAWQGPAQPSPFTAPGWKPGDKASWEQQLRVRTQRQNEYVRIG